jgi:hypothetical protein
LKKAFTLFELIIAVILVSLLYYFAIDSFSQKNFKEKKNITLTNLKQTLLQYDFNDNITIQCIEDDFSCFVFIDDILQKEKINPLFKEVPTIYNYAKDLTRVDFNELELEQLDTYNIVFKYSCKKDKKCSEYIVELPNKVYIFNDIYTKPTTINYISDINDYFDNKIQEVKDAF